MISLSLFSGKRTEQLAPLLYLLHYFTNWNTVIALHCHCVNVNAQVKLEILFGACHFSREKMKYASVEGSTYDAGRKVSEFIDVSCPNVEFVKPHIALLLGLIDYRIKSLLVAVTIKLQHGALD